MTARALLLEASLAASFLFSAQQCFAAEEGGGVIVKIAELDIDPAQLDAYKLALKEEIGWFQRQQRLFSSGQLTQPIDRIWAAQHPTRQPLGRPRFLILLPRVPTARGSRPSHRQNSKE